MYCTTLSNPPSHCAQYRQLILTFHTIVWKKLSWSVISCVIFDAVSLYRGSTFQNEAWDFSPSLKLRQLRHFFAVKVSTPAWAVLNYARVSCIWRNYSSAAAVQSLMPMNVKTRCIARHFRKNCFILLKRTRLWLSWWQITTATNPRFLLKTFESVNYCRDQERIPCIIKALISFFECFGTFSKLHFDTYSIWTVNQDAINLDWRKACHFLKPVCQFFFSYSIPWHQIPRGPIHTTKLE